MTIHNLYMFDRQGSLMYYGEWNRNRKPENMLNINEEAKLMYGMLYSIKNFVNKMSPHDVREGFQCYKTSKYVLNYFETPSGIKYVMNTDLQSQGVRELLQTINSQIYIEYCVKNPAYNYGEPIQSELFKTKLDELVKQSPIFKS
uniref:Trafficking protein particle complex subunit n=1 Tax=Scapholeberis mucronata TaxID=202097 RepID=A0A4Y7NPB9_9CRUS|nr:EOG090X0HJH [Scapholeberis mucronata]